MDEMYGKPNSLTVVKAGKKWWSKPPGYQQQGSIGDFYFETRLEEAQKDRWMGQVKQNWLKIEHLRVWEVAAV